MEFKGNAAVNYNGSVSNHPTIFDNVGWVRGTTLAHGEWGAYLWVIQNQIAFKSSTSAWWRVSTNGFPVAITNVIVGSLGTYPATTDVVDIGPHLDEATNNFPGNNQSESREFYVDITNVYYQLIIPDIWITPRSAMTCVGGSNVQFVVTGTNIPLGVSWSLIPDLSGSGGAEILSNGAWRTEIMPENVGTNYIVRATSKVYTNFCDQVSLTVLKVESIEWETYPGNTALDTCPKNGGKRILPDKQTPTDSSAADRKKVRIKAKITPAVSGQTVYFRVFDVDDPSSSASPVDSNDGSGATGADNYGTDGGLSETSATTDSSDYATVQFTVSMQPGDNFRAFASCSDSALNALTQSEVDSGSIPAGIEQSDMLTVWRRLWLEFDSMGTWPSSGDEKNFDEGLIDSVLTNTPQQGQSTLNLNNKLTDEADRYEGGFIVIDGNITNTVLNNTDNLVYDDDVVVAGIVSTSVVGKTYTIYDDDAVQIGSRAPRMMPYTLSGGTLINTAFADAYIKPESVPAEYIDNDVPFNRNLEGVIEWPSVVGSHKDLSDAEDFWLVYLLAAYQSEVATDYDPDTGNPQIIKGEAQDAFNRGAIYVEPIRELENVPVYPRQEEEHSVVHEIGHEGGGSHSDGGIMADGAPVNENQFTPLTIKTFREEQSF
ncbi:MAG: hypothetical protein PHW60_01770 [Kiritimatiellae bacterium]|nr:hypothetical protein [Kiritimatiellia bacterium]